MKILHLVDYYQPELGYQEPLLAQEHVKQGHEVLVVTSDRYFPFADYDKTYKKILGPRKIKSGESSEHGIRVLRLPVILELGTVPIHIGIMHAILNYSPDILCLHGSYKISTLVGLISKRLLSTKCNVIVDTHEAEFNTNFSKNFFTKLYYFFIVKMLIRPIMINTAHKFIAIGKPELLMLSKLMGLTSNQIQILPPGVDSQQFKPNDKERLKLRRSLNINKSDFTLLFTGKIEPRKKLELLITSFRKLNRNIRKLRLIIVGDGNSVYVNNLKKQAKKEGLSKEQITWISMVPHNQLAKFYQASDVGVWPGDVSVSRFEALSVGLQVIVPNNRLSEDLIKKKCVLSFSPGSAASLMLAVKQAYQLRYNNNVNKYNREIALRDYSWRTIATEFISLIGENYGKN